MGLLLKGHPGKMWWKPHCKNQSTGGIATHASSITLVEDKRSLNARQSWQTGTHLANAEEEIALGGAGSGDSKGNQDHFLP
eukprot:868062-Amphidinium_carterae.1